MKLFTAFVTRNHSSVPVYTNSRKTGASVGTLYVAHFGPNANPYTGRPGKARREYKFVPNAAGKKLHLKQTKSDNKRVALQTAMRT